MIGKEILGIYLEREKLQYACIRSRFGMYAPKRPASGLEPAGTVAGSLPVSLKGFLQKVPADRSRHIYLCLPRNQFFARDVQLPSMPVEDALMSIRNSLSLYCHLPLEEIYHDIHLCRSPQGSINALIFYAPRKEIDGLLEIFRETDHRSSLKGLFPVSYGIGAWLNLQRYPFPLALVFAQDGIRELAIFHKKGLLSSTVLPGTGEEETTASGTTLARFQLTADRVFRLNSTGEATLPPPPKKLPGAFPGISENFAMAAASAGLARLQQISIDGSPTRIRIFRPAKLILPILILLSLAVFLSTRDLKENVVRKEEALAQLQTQVSQLQEQLKPIEQRKESVRKAQAFVEDIKDFLKSRPKLFTTINGLAELVPEGAWFSTFNFENAMITATGQSKDALKVVETLRTSNLFDQVRLSGPVSRLGTGEERFTVTLKMKEGN